MVNAKKQYCVSWRNSFANHTLTTQDVSYVTAYLTKQNKNTSGIQLIYTFAVSLATTSTCMTCVQPSRKHPLHYVLQRPLLRTPLYIYIYLPLQENAPFSIHESQSLFTLSMLRLLLSILLLVPMQRQASICIYEHLCRLQSTTPMLFLWKVLSFFPRPILASLLLPLHRIRHRDYIVKLDVCPSQIFWGYVYVAWWYFHSCLSPSWQAHNR